MVQDSSLADKIVPSRRAARAAMVKCKEQQQSGRSSKQEITHSTTDPPHPANTDEHPIATTIPVELEGTGSTNNMAKPLLSTSSPKPTKSDSKTLKKVKSVQNLHTREPSQASRSSRFISPLTDTSTETEPRATNKRKGARANGGVNRKRAKLEHTVSETRIQDLIRPVEGVSFLTNPPSAWSLDKLDKFVYVRLGKDGYITPSTDSCDKPPGYWWPAQVKSIDDVNHSLVANLYGDDGYGERREVVTNEPSYSSVNTWKGVNSIASFIQGSFDGIIEPRLLKVQFRTAREAMQADIGLQKVVSPTEGENTLRKASPAVGRGLALNLVNQTIRVKSDDPRDNEPSPDASLQIPGELVLAREPKAKHAVYWPGRILEFSPNDPNNDKDFPGYMVQIFPEPEAPQKLRRSYFCTTVEDDFLTCKAGEWQTEFADNHIPRDDDAPSRSPTPEPQLRADPGVAPSPKEFRNLDIDEQVRFIQTILSLIIEGRYIPAVPDHIAFLQGGDNRTKVAQLSGQDGCFSKGEITNIRYEIMRWALRDERRSQRLLVDVEDYQTEQAPNEVKGNDCLRRRHPPRPRGDGLYERLTQTERIQYCTDFLCRQALIQLIMWREGLRTTTYQRAPDDERQAYNTAADKLAEGHWWEDVKNRRKDLLEKKREQEHTMPGDLDRRARRRK